MRVRFIYSFIALMALCSHSALAEDTKLSNGTGLRGGGFVVTKGDQLKFVDLLSGSETAKDFINTEQYLKSQQIKRSCKGTNIHYINGRPQNDPLYGMDFVGSTLLQRNDLHTQLGKYSMSQYAYSYAWLLRQLHGGIRNHTLQLEYVPKDISWIPNSGIVAKNSLQKKVLPVGFYNQGLLLEFLPVSKNMSFEQKEAFYWHELLRFWSSIYIHNFSQADVEKGVKLYSNRKYLDLIEFMKLPVKNTAFNDILKLAHSLSNFAWNVENVGNYKPGHIVYNKDFKEIQNLLSSLLEGNRIYDFLLKNHLLVSALEFTFAFVFSLSEDIEYFIDAFPSVESADQKRFLQQAEQVHQRLKTLSIQLYNETSSYRRRLGSRQIKVEFYRNIDNWHLQGSCGSKCPPAKSIRSGKVCELIEGYLERYSKVNVDD